MPRAKSKDFIERYTYSCKKAGAKKRGTYFCLSYEYWLEMATSDCFYCGEAPSNVFRYCDGEFRYSGIDRVDNALGYIPGNCLPACKHCNAGKEREDFDFFISHCEKIANHDGSSKRETNFIAGDDKPKLSGYKIIAESEKREKSGSKMWVVECSGCKREFIRRKETIENSLGCHSCVNVYKRAATPESIQKNHWIMFNSHCKRKGIENKLTFERWVELKETSCHFCGTQHSNTLTLGHRNDMKWLCNGIDRLDSSKGYTEENSVPCCKYCNKFKLELSEEEFITKAKRVVEKNSQKIDENVVFDLIDGITLI